jgi:hypothetical protein
MVKDRRRVALALLALVLAGSLYWTLSGGGGGTPVATRTAPRAVRGTAETGVPRIGLDRLEAQAAAAGVGQRDIFDFGEAPEAPPPVAPPPSLAAGPAVAAAPTPAPPPPLNLKYIGAVENSQGLKVAVLMTDRKEVLTGRPGDLVANRYRIVQIGLESVDIQEVGTERVRRVPLRSN